MTKCHPKTMITLLIAFMSFTAKAEMMSTQCQEENNPSLKDTISSALCLAKKDYFKKSLGLLDAVQPSNEITPLELEKLALTKIIIRYHRYVYYKEKSSKEAAAMANELMNASDEFAKNSLSENFTRLALSMQAKVAFSEGQFQTAGELWTSILHKNPPDNLFHESMVGIIRSEIALGRYAQVIKSVRQFLARYAETMDVTRRQSLTDELVKTSTEYAELLAKEGKHSDAAAVLQEMTTAIPKTSTMPQILLQQAFYFGSAQKWDEAITTSEHILAEPTASKQDQATASYLRAKALEHKLDLQRAADALLAFSRSYPRHERAFAAAEKAAELFSAEGYLKKSAIALLQAANLNKEVSSLLYLKAGENLILEGDVNKAKSILPHIEESQLETNSLARLQLLRGEILLKTEGIEKALSDLEKTADFAKALDPSLARIGAKASLLIADAYLPELERVKLSGNLNLVRERFASKAEVYESKISKYLQNVISSTVPQLHVEAAQKLAKISLNFQQEIDYAANFITTDLSLRQNMKQYSQILAKVTPLYLKEQHALDIRLPQQEEKKQDVKTSPQTLKKIDFFQDHSLGSF